MFVENERLQANIRTTFKIDFQVRCNTTYIYDILKRFILLRTIVNDLTTNADIVPNISDAQQKKLNLTFLSKSTNGL